MSVDLLEGVDDRDTGMGQRGGGACFTAEPLAALRVVGHAGRESLQGHCATEPDVLGEIDDAHPAAPELPAHDIWADLASVLQRRRTECPRVGLERRRLFEKIARGPVRVEERLRLVPERLVVGAGAAEPVRTGGGRLLERAVKQRLQAIPALGIHASSRLSHARARAHWRLTVAGELRIASAVSSMVSPPK